MRARLAVLVAALLLLSSGCSGDEPRSAGPAEVPSTSPAASADLLAADEIERNLDEWFAGTEPIYPTVLSVLVRVDDEPVVERSYDQRSAEAHDIASVTKSVVSTLVGIAVDDGLLSLDDRLADLLPTYAGSMSAEVADLRLEQLLTMRAGFPADPDSDELPFMRSRDWVEQILLDGQERPAGDFAYSSTTSHLLGAIVAEATGRSLLDFAEERLFGPLGIDTLGMTTPLFSLRNLEAYDEAPLAWPVDPSGRNTGWGFLKLRPQDLVRIGQLYLDGGTWHGRRILSREWIDEATADHLEIPEPGGMGYGFQWWVTEAGGAHAAVAMGFGGQLIEVVPDHRLVVVTTSRIKDPPVLHPAQLLEVVDEAIFEQP